MVGEYNTVIGDLNRVQIENWSFETKESGARSRDLGVSGSKYDIFGNYGFQSRRGLRSPKLERDHRHLSFNLVRKKLLFQRSLYIIKTVKIYQK